MDLMDYRRKIIANSPHLASASGAVVTFADGTDLPLKSLNVDIEPVQSGSGDPSPDNVRLISGWNAVKVTRTGKNMYSRENGEYNVPVFDASGNSQSYPDVNVVWVKVKPNTAYTTTLIPNSSRAAYARWIECDEYKNFIWRDSNMNSGSYLTRTRTTRSNTRWVQIACNQYQTAQISNNAWEIMFVEGSTATPYEPYNGVTVTVQLGQTVYGGTLNPLTGVLRAYPYYASYNGETLTGRWVSDRDKYVAGTTPTIGAQVVDMSGTGTEIQLTPQQIRSLYGNNTIFADTGNVALEYWAHP